MTTNDDSAPSVPQPIDPASRIALVVLADYFNERHTNRAAFAEQCREDDPDAYPEQMAIADTWRRAANIVSVIAHSHPNGPETSWKFTIKIGASELGKLIAMATASTPERIAELEEESTQLQEATDAMHKAWPDDIAWRGSLAEWIEAFAAFASRSPANECSDGERTQYELTIEQQKEKIAELDRKNDTALREEHRLGTDVTILRGQSTVDKHNLEQAHAKIAELQARIAELTKVPVVDGQTPGEVLILSMHGCTSTQVSREMLESAEIDARAVLRVFGKGDVHE